MNKKKMSLIILAAVLFALWMCFSTPILAGLYNAPHGVRKLSSYPDRGADLGKQCAFGKWSANDDMFSSVEIMGIASCYTKYDGQSDIAAYMCSKDGVYAVPVKALPIGEGAAKLIVGEYEKEKTPFECAFCPLVMRDGRYRFTVELKEEGAVQSLDYTEVYMTKRGEEVTVERYLNAPAEPVAYTVSEAVRYHFDELTAQDGSLKLTGWAYVQGIAYQTPLYDFIVETTDAAGVQGYYYTHITERRDAAAELGLGDNFYIGFESDIPQSGVVSVRLILQTTDGYAAADSVEIQ